MKYIHKFYCVCLFALCLLIIGCSNKNYKNEYLVNITVEEMTEKMINKDTFIIVFTQPACGYCNSFKNMLNTYLNDNQIILFELSSDREAMKLEDFKTRMKAIKVYFPEIEKTPDLYYVENGVIADRLDANEIDISVEKNFDEWIKRTVKAKIN